MACLDMISSTNSSYNPTWYMTVYSTQPKQLTPQTVYDSVASPSDFLLVDNRPAVLSLLTFYYVWLIQILPQLMLNRKPFDLRPWMVVYNGLMFGAYGAGFIIFIYCFPPWRYIMYGEAATLETPTVKIFYMYIHALIFWARMVDLIVPIFAVLRGKNRSRAALHGLWTSIIVACYSLGYRLESKEPYTLLPAFDGAKVILRMIHHILTAPGTSFYGPKFDRSTVHIANIIINAIGLSFIGYLFTTNYKFSRELYQWVVIITLIETSFHVIGLIMGRRNSKMLTKMEGKSA